jgi:hypothetical protein
VRTPVCFRDNHPVVGAGDISLGPTLQTSVREHRGALFVQFGSLCLSEEFLIRILGRAL